VEEAAVTPRTGTWVRAVVKRYHPLGPDDDAATRANASTFKTPGCELPPVTGSARRSGATITVDWKVGAVPAACGRAEVQVAARNPAPPYQATLKVITERGQWRTTRVVVAE
jgi:hypothetical protein